MPNPTIELCEVSMFAALGNGTQLSASGFTRKARKAPYF